MEPVPPEQPQPPESATQKGIVVPKYIIRPFARGLSQMASDPLKKLREELLKIRPTDITADNLDTQTQQRGQLSEMKQAFNALTATLVMMRLTKEVKIIHPTKDQYKLVFSRETEEEEIPREGEVSIGESLTHPLVSATFDRLGHDLAMFGHAELLSVRGESEELKEKMRFISSVAQELDAIWKPMQTANYKLKISTDGEEKTTITPVPKPTPSLIKRLLKRP